MTQPNDLTPDRAEILARVERLETGDAERRRLADNTLLRRFGRSLTGLLRGDRNAMRHLLPDSIGSSAPQ